MLPILIFFHLLQDKSLLFNFSFNMYDCHLFYNTERQLLFRDSYRVVGFEMETYSVDKDELTFNDEFSCQFASDAKPQLVNEDTGTKLYFTYAVEWGESEIGWASRWDIYLGMKDVQIHWFSIINSIVVLFFLSGWFQIKYFYFQLSSTLTLAKY